MLGPYMVSHMANHDEPLDRVFHALSDPTRRAIVMQLTRRPTAVSALFAPLTMAMPTLLKHIPVLEDSGLVASKKTAGCAPARCGPLP
jgi:DNA-binding transcriptional ArsR family regulator